MHRGREAEDDAWWDIRHPATQLSVLLAIAAALGGGGSQYPFHNLAVQLTALAVLAANRARVVLFLREAPRVLVALTAISLFLPLLQTVPLPPALWQALPGRGVIAESLTLAGWGTDRWMPFSLDPARSLLAFFAAIVPATMIALGWSLSMQERLRLGHVAIGAALAGLVLGAVQLASANTSAILFDDPVRRDVLYGVFANRNSAGLSFVIAIAFLLALPRPADRLRAWGMFACSAVLALGVLLTQSRSAIVLLLPVLVLAAMRAAVGRPKARQARSRSLALGIGAAGVLAVAAVLTAPPGNRIETSLGRFATIETDRLGMWEDTAYAARQYAPMGAGTGVFKDVFQLHESLEHVSERRAGRAHNDWLELALENGAAGLALAVAWLATLAALARRRWQAGFRWQAAGGGMTIAVIAAQSVLDYPLRSLSLLAMAAMAVILLLPERRFAGER